MREDETGAVMWDAQDELTHMVESIEQGDFEMNEGLTVQKYADGSIVLVNGHSWTVESMSRDSERLLPIQPDKGEDYNLYRLSRHNTKSILRWQHELDHENVEKPQDDFATEYEQARAIGDRIYGPGRVQE